MSSLLFYGIFRDADFNASLFAMFVFFMAYNMYMGIPFWNCFGYQRGNHYLCTVHAAKMMTTRRSGLIVNVSSIGGLRYFFNVPYGVGKEAVDRMAADCAVELKKKNVACVSLWPGPVKTETMDFLITKSGKSFDNSSITGLPKMESNKIIELGESIEYSGKGIVALATDPNVMKKTGKILMTSDLGYEYGFKDIDGTEPLYFTQVNNLFKMSSKTAWMARFVPDFVCIPKWLVAFAGHKF